jgi:hypothetical protein
VLALAALSGAGVGGAATPDTTGPPCADVVVFSPSFAPDATTGTPTVTGILGTASGGGFCKFATYTVTVTDLSGNVVYTRTYSGSELSDPTQLAIPITSGDTSVILSVTSSLGGHTADVASGQLDLSGPVGAEFFN